MCANRGLRKTANITIYNEAKQTQWHTGQSSSFAVVLNVRSTWSVSDASQSTLCRVEWHHQFFVWDIDFWLLRYDESDGSGFIFMRPHNAKNSMSEWAIGRCTLCYRQCVGTRASGGKGMTFVTLPFKLVLLAVMWSILSLPNFDCEQGLLQFRAFTHVAQALARDLTF